MKYKPIPVGAPSHTDSKMLTVSDYRGVAYNKLHEFSVPAIPPSSQERTFYPLIKDKRASRPQEGRWSEIKESGVIKMTEMSAIDETTENYLGVMPQERIAFSTNSNGINHNASGSCKVNSPFIPNLFLHKDSYIEQGDLSYWSEKFPNALHYPLVEEIDEAKVNRAMADAFAELYQGYNLGEELYELKESLSTVIGLFKQAKKLTFDFKRTYDQLLKKGLRKEAANAWMTYRYGILPIMYSVRDIYDLLNDEGEYKTVRRSVTAEGKPPVSDYGTRFVEEGSLSKTVNITVKGRWASSRSKNLDRININPITTLLEVHPYAMVIRWFFNTSGYFNSLIKSVTSTALQAVGCVATKTTGEVSTYLYHQTDTRVSISEPGDSGCGSNWFGITNYGNHGDLVDHRILLSKRTVNNYDRYLYDPHDVKLSFDPHITYSRLIDLIIMFGGNLRKIF